MGITDLIYGDKKLAQIGVVQFDASIDELHVSTAEVTSHAVEKGPNISDHIRVLPDEITITGVVTNTPVVFLASINAKSPLTNSFLPEHDRVEAALSELRRAQKGEKLLDVITTLAEYSNMAILSLSVTRNAQKGNILEVTVSLKEVLSASSFSLELPDPVNVSNKAEEDKGKKPKEKPKKKQVQKNESLASKFVGAFFGG